jgi:hypothetical protein
MSHGVHSLQPDVNNLTQLSVVVMPSTSNRVGGIMPGAALAVDTSGILSVTPATTSHLGGIIAGSGLAVKSDGTLSLAPVSQISVNGTLVGSVTNAPLSVNGIAMP